MRAGRRRSVGGSRPIQQAATRRAVRIRARRHRPLRSVSARQELAGRRSGRVRFVVTNPRMVMTLRTPVLLALVGLATVFLAACGSDKSVSSASLKRQLLKASAVPGYGLQRTLDWNDPVDLVGQGIFLPELTKPSAAVKVMKTAGLRGAAGEVLARGGGLNASAITIGVAKVKSADSAH